MQTKRPYRLYNSKTRKFLPHYNYVYLRNAHMGALIQARWAEIGTTLEVIMVPSQTVLGQYRRGVDAVKFIKCVGDD